jgi:poly(3-hydroxybutyrate) depolymerase
MKQLLPLLVIIFSMSLKAQVSQPSQPSSGPGGSDYTHGGVTIYDYGTNGNGGDFWLYEPNSPTPDSANVVVFCHGLGMLNPRYYGAFIKHLVRQGNIVIYPRYQKDLNASNATFNDSCAKGIQRGLDTIQQAGHVKGRIANYFILGHSVGGVLTANMTMLHAQYGLPKPLAAFSMQPGAAGFLMNDYSSFPADVKYLIAIGDNDLIVGTAPGTTLYNQTTAVPTSHKNLVKHYADTHGDPDIGATHGEPGSGDDAFDNGETNLFITFAPPTPPDALDYYGYWKLQDALMDCALNSQNCEYAFGDTPEQHGVGDWSDGTPVRILEVTPSALSAIRSTDDKVLVSIFPNPATESMYFTVSEPQANLQVNILDELGRIVAQQSFNNLLCKVETGNLKPGMYFYQLKLENEVVKGGKVVIE